MFSTTSSDLTKSAYQTDSKNNLISVCLFESYFAKETIEHQDIFKDSYLKLLDALENFLRGEGENKLLLNEILKHKPKRFNLDREVFSSFSCLNQQFPGYNSFQSIKQNFSLSASNYLIKLIADHILKLPEQLAASNSFFSGQYNLRSPYSPLRVAELFHESNRGVTEIDCDLVSSKSLGIVEEQYQPNNLQDYYEHEIYPSMYLYEPKEDSYVAEWLRKRNLPIISGSSGSTELLFSYVFPLANLSKDEKKLIIFAQAMDMVAHGHHSLFEALIVAEHFKLDACLSGDVDLLSYYLHWVPQGVKETLWFNTFLKENSTVPVIKGYKLNLDMNKEGDETMMSQPMQLTDDEIILLNGSNSFRL